MFVIFVECGIVDDVLEFVEEIDNSEKDDFVFMGCGVYIKRMYVWLEGEEVKMYVEEEECCKCIEYFCVMMVEENVREVYEVEEEYV